MAEKIMGKIQNHYFGCLKIKGGMFCSFLHQILISCLLTENLYNLDLFNLPLDV